MAEKENFGLYDPRFEHDGCGVGFVADIQGRRSHRLVEQGITALKRLLHRGAVGADPRTGDGAGILIQTPHEFFASVFNHLPEPGDYGSGLVFLPCDKEEREECKAIIADFVRREGQELLGWRPVPVNNSEIGRQARDTRPVIEQLFIGKGKKTGDRQRFEIKLYVIRRQAENFIRASGLKQKSYFYIANLSSRTFCYKGLLMSSQLDSFFPDLKDEKLKSAIALVHARYSTNTFPTWDLAQPFRYLAHNGEINTLRGNINWMKAREGLLASPLFKDDIEKIKSVIVPGGSDSAMIDNIFELLTLAGRSLPHAMLLLIPAAWENDALMDEKLRDFYRYHACVTEPWDGPAAIAFSDGVRVGAVLDRNGLRPARYIVTNDDLVVMASEVGVLDIEPEKIKVSGRLEPGKIFFIDTEEKRIIQDDEVKAKLAEAQPYGQWLKDNIFELKPQPSVSTGAGDVLQQLKAFGYSREDLKFIIGPMAESGQEPVGSMGNDSPPAVLSPRPQLLYSYFKQLFAQVTNPAIDPIREELVMSLESFVGPQLNVLEETPAHARKLRIKDPILTNEELAALRDLKTKSIPLLFHDGEKGLSAALDKICRSAEEAIVDGYDFILLSDRGVNREAAAIPALLAVGAVHHHLVKKSMRSQIGIILESGEPREVHHFALLFGYGADCVNPYLAYQAVEYLIGGAELILEAEKALRNYRKAVGKGILKILSKMGISTLRSYRGAQIFEALGLSEELIEKYFTGTVSRVGGAGLEVIARETMLRHREAFVASQLNTGGVYQWRRDGEFHLWSPDSIAALQDAVRNDDFDRYREFAALINDQSKQPTTLRGLLKFKKANSIPIDEVEPATEIYKRFATGAMSFGSISRGAHETIALALNRLGGRSNTGEGGEDPARFIPLANGDSLCSKVKQVASGRFGVTANYLVNAQEIQIKIAQGAKPGEGGQLPGHKVSAIIARTRYTTPGVTLISPPPHHDIYSIEDLAQLIFDLKNVNPRARISVKLVSEIGVGTIAMGVAKGHADMILISGGDGGTGASPLSSIRHAGLPWELGISETHQILVMNDLRSRVRLQTDGQMRTGRDVAVAAMLGAEEYGFCTAVLIAMGCVMLRHCHLNTCSVGVATQDEILEKRFRGRPEYLQNYFRFIVQELREIMARLGIRKINELIGRTDLLEMNTEILPWKAKGIDYSKILWKPEVAGGAGVYKTKEQDHGIAQILDRKLIELAQPALEKREPVVHELSIRNSDRTAGAMLSGELCRRWGEEGLSDDTIRFKFKGAAGQSFGAWLARGITFELEGLANDYVGKGISGGKIIIYPDRKSDYKPEENIVIGNTTFYGAIAGEAYIRGLAGERFCIRNSGLLAVVEGVGDHGCEYMTGGRVVILGRTGRNFGAGMSGGIAYVYDEDGTFPSKCNTGMVELEKPNDEDKKVINDLLFNHHNLTRSAGAKQVLDNFQRELKKFVKVMPLEYKRILAAREAEKKQELLEVSDG